MSDHTQRHPRRLLITAGPTHEPSDAVRYIGNRSSGRLGVALADAGAQRGLEVTLLLGPTHLLPADTRVRVERFRTTHDLQTLLERHAPTCDVLVMAAAVADYRPKSPQGEEVKISRAAAGLTIELEGTPDLIAGCAARKRPGQLFVGFALEPRERLMASAARKLASKRLDAIVANPLETMDSETIECVLLRSGDASPLESGKISKARFAQWLLDALQLTPQAG